MCIEDPSLPRVVAVVVTHNRPALLKSAIAALKSQTLIPQEIVIVDNASSAETVLFLRQEPELTVLRLEQNMGGSGGFAAGIEVALKMEADWIWLVDDDAIPKQDALENLLCRPSHVNYDADDLAVLCPSVEEDGKVAPMHRRYFDPLTLSEKTVPYRKYADTVVEIDTASFVGFLVKSEAIRRVGLPDVRFFLGYDDIEFSLRLKQAGYRLYLLPESVVDHRRPRNVRLRHGPYRAKHYYNLRNRFIVYRKFGRAPAWRWAYPFVQGLVLLLIAGKGQPAAARLWWKSMCDARKEPQALDGVHTMY